MNLPLCPQCSFFVRRHPELREDNISRPDLISKPTGHYIAYGCVHAATIFGPHATQEAAEAAWVAIVEEMESELSDEKKSDLAQYEEREKRLLADHDFSLPSLGAGVQSSTMAVMAAAGEITPMPPAAIFADTQAEPASVLPPQNLKGTLL